MSNTCYYVRIMRDFAYLAGYFDGEGSICIMKGGPGGKWPYLRVTLVTSDEEPVKLASVVFGGKCRSVKHNNKPTRPRKTLYRWSVGNVEATKVLKKLKPFLLAKKDQAELALSVDWSLLRSPEMLQARLSAKDKMTILNHRISR